MQYQQFWLDNKFRLPKNFIKTATGTWNGACLGSWNGRVPFIREKQNGEEASATPTPSTAATTTTTDLWGP